LKKYFTLDFILLAALAAFVTLQPYFKHGMINFYETGIYLPQINEFLHGKALYKDIFVLRGPLEIIMPAFMMKFFGMHAGVLNAYFYFGTALTLFIYALFALRLFKTRGFVYLFTMVLIARTFPWSCFNVWGGIRFGLGILGVLLAVNFLRNKKSIQLLFSGMLTSFAFWTSFELGVFSFISIMTALFLCGYVEIKDIRVVFRYILIYIAGNIIASFPFILYLFLNNAFFFYLDTVYVVLTKTSKVFNPALCFETPMNLKEFVVALYPLNHNFKYTLPFLFYAAVFAYLLRISAKRKFDVSDISISAIAVYGILLYISTFRNVEGPQYRMTLQPLLLVMFFYLERFYAWNQDLKQSMHGLKKALIIFILFIIPVYALSFSVSKYSKRFFIFKDIKEIVLRNKRVDIPYTNPDPTPVETNRAKGIIVPGPQAREIDGIVEYITVHAGKRDAVFTFPDLGTYNFLTDRPSVGKFYCAELSFMDPQWFEGMFVELKNTKPRFIICAKEFTRLKPFMPDIGKYLDRMTAFLRESYSVKMSFETVNIFERKM